MEQYQHIKKCVVFDLGAGISEPTLSIFQVEGFVVQSCPTLCDPMDHSTPGPPIFHCLGWRVAFINCFFARVFVNCKTILIQFCTWKLVSTHLFPVNNTSVLALKLCLLTFYHKAVTKLKKNKNATLIVKYLHFLKKLQLSEFPN